ncbi:MAG: hypothetical protein ACE5IC_05615 [Candidatus Brocadiales bacterium]
MERLGPQVAKSIPCLLILPLDLMHYRDECILLVVRGPVSDKAGDVSLELVVMIPAEVPVTA